MNLKKLGIIIQREYLNKVKKKSFLLTTFGVPILFAGMYAVMLFVMLKAEGDSKRIAVIDNSGIVMEKLENTKLITFTQLSETDPEAVIPRRSRTAWATMTRTSSCTSLRWTAPPSP